MDKVTDYSARPISRFDRAFRTVFASKLRQFSNGRLALCDGDWQATFGSTGNPPLSASLDIHDSRVYRSVLFGGTIGAAEAYAQGWWTTDDLTTLVRIMARNRQAAEGLDGTLTRVRDLFHRAIHRWRDNRRSQSRRNISAHYDLGNDFFSLFLDPTMTYSCAVFPRDDSTLQEASEHKLGLICQRLDLLPSDELLEIGTGWGSLAMYAAKRYGCRVTTTTISREQYRYAVAAVEQAGLTDRVTVLNVDYRDLPNIAQRQFDKVVSVEMLEAVGQQFLDQYFQVCDRLTKPGGVMLLQSIVIADELYESYRHSVDFIQRYIFPGGFLPSVGDLRQRLPTVTDFEVVDIQDITEHYPPTLRHWRDQLHRNWGELESLGYPSQLLRLWEYYFSYSEGGFLERTIGDVQIALTK